MILANAVPAAGISDDDMLAFLVQIGILVAVAVLLGRFAARIGLPAVVGELSAGVLLGPTLLGEPLVTLASPSGSPNGPMNLILAVAQLGVLMLIALTGGHIDLPGMRRSRRALAFVSTGSVVLPLAAGVGLGLLLPAWLRGPTADPRTFALFTGVAIAVSALPVIAKTLIDLRLLHREVGQLIVGAAAISDIIGWLLLAAVSTMVVAGGGLGSVGLSVVYLLGTLVVTVVVVRPLGRVLLDRSSRSPHPEVGTAVVVVLVVACAAGTLVLGLEPILGAFLCGLAIGSLGRHARGYLESLRPVVMSFLAPLFFATAGLKLDLGVLAHGPTLLVAVVAVLVASVAKLCGGYAGARIGGLGHRTGLAIGAGLNARGVVEIVIATVGLQLGILSPAMYAIVIVVAVATSVMTPPLLRLATRGIPTTDAEREREQRFSPSPG